MRDLYESSVVPAYLDQASVNLLEQGRSAYDQYQLAGRRILQAGDDCVIFPWRGSHITNTINVMLNVDGIQAGVDGATITCRDIRLAELLGSLALIANTDPPDGVDLANSVPAKIVDKNDQFLGENLLALAYAARDLDPMNAREGVGDLVESMVR